MSAATQILNASDLTNEQLDRITFAFFARLEQYGIVEKPLSAEKAIEFLGRGRATFYRLINLGVFKGHYPDPNGHPFYFPSDMIAGIKKHRL